MTIWEKEIGYSAIPLCDWSRTVQRLESSRLSTTLKIIIIGYRLILIFFWNAFHVIKKWGKRNLKTLNQNPFLRPLAWNWWTEINAYKVLSETKSQKKKKGTNSTGIMAPTGLEFTPPDDAYFLQLSNFHNRRFVSWWFLSWDSISLLVWSFNISLLPLPLPFSLIG